MSNISIAYGKWMTRLRDTNNVWTENDIIYFRKAIGYCGIKDPELRKQLRKQFDVFAEKNEGYLITNEQSEKGRTYLLDRSLRKNGELRKGCKLGSREIDILRDLDYHRFVGLWEQHNGFGDVMGYLPVYRAVAQNGNSFEYVGATYEMMEVVG